MTLRGPRTIHQLRQNAFASNIPLGEADSLLASVLDKPKEYLLAHDEAIVSPWQRRRFLHALKRRATGIPLAYLLGHKEFFGLDFIVNRHVLVPRPETEILVEIALERLKNNESKKAALLIDVGTGSGCIPIAITKNTHDKNITAFATDISRPALRIAKKNAARHGVQIHFSRGYLLQPILKKNLPPSSVIITANLPYLTQAQFESEPSIQHEPVTALVAAHDGLALYEELLQQIQRLVINKQFSTIACFFEIDPAQSSTLQTRIASYLPAATVTIKKDLARRDRVCCIYINAT